MAKSLKHLTERAAEYSNIADSLDYELRGKRKFFTNNDKMKQALDMAREKNMLPFTATVKADGGYGYIFT